MLGAIHVGVHNERSALHERCAVTLRQDAHIRTTAIGAPAFTPHCYCIFIDEVIATGIGSLTQVPYSCSHLLTCTLSLYVQRHLLTCTLSLLVSR